MIEIHQVLWKVQLWLDDQLIEEHIAPPDLAEQYAKVIRLRIRNLPGRRLRCEPVSREPGLGSAREEDPRDGRFIERQSMESDNPAL